MVHRHAPPDISNNVVFFPLPGCRVDFGSPAAWLRPMFDLQGDTDVKVLQKTAKCVRVQCASAAIKSAMLKWDVRNTVAAEFALVVQEDLFWFERMQKRGMRPVMQAVFDSGLKPTWHRASVAWKCNGKWFSFRPGEVPLDHGATRIQQLARLKCGRAQRHLLQSSRLVVPCHSDETAPSKSCQSPVPAPTSQTIVAAVPQDVAADAPAHSVTDSIVECQLGETTVKLPACVAEPLQLAWNHAMGPYVQTVEVCFLGSKLLLPAVIAAAVKPQLATVEDAVRRSEVVEALNKRLLEKIKTLKSDASPAG